MFKIKSPINGTVDEVDVKVGQSVSPLLPAARVINESDLKISARISEAYVTNISKGNKVIVSIPELKKDINATVTFVAKNIDPLSRTFNVEIKLPSLPELRPNMTATIKVVFETIPSAIVVPVNVLQSINNEKIVYVAEKKGDQTIAKKKVVTIDGVYANLAHVEGLQAGDKIITVGYEGLNDGDYVKL
jgi:RND family efflux transporter MFP subunit